MNAADEQLRHRLRLAIDHTLLDPLATAGAVEALCVEAVTAGIAQVCVSPTRVAIAVAATAGTGVAVCSVIGFPSGAHPAVVKAAEVAHVVDLGAVEVDTVVNLGAVMDGDWSTVSDDVAAVVAAARRGGARTKVILESAAIGPERLVAAVRVAVQCGADFVKTSTGYHPAGGATVAAVQAMMEAAAGRARVKASGGIRTLADAVTMLDAGADRLGTSRGAAILAELDARDPA